MPFEGGELNDYKKEKGTSIGKALLFLVVISLCAGLLGGVCGGVIAHAVFDSFNFEYEEPLDTPNVDENYADAQEKIALEDLIGRWDLCYMETEGVTITPDTLSAEGYADDIIEAYFSGTYIQIPPDIVKPVEKR